MNTVQLIRPEECDSSGCPDFLFVIFNELIRLHMTDKSVSRFNMKELVTEIKKVHTKYIPQAWLKAGLKYRTSGWNVSIQKITTVPGLFFEEGDEISTNYYYVFRPPPP